MKKVLFLIFASLLVLGACGQSEDHSKKDDDKKSESKSDKKSNDPKKDNTKDKKSKEEEKEKSANESNEQNSSSTEEKNNENQNSQKQSSQEKSNQNIDLSNIQDRNTLESIIYGNYTEEQKVQAYKSAVANGVIPQGNVMEGPASAAYESSLRVESGQEKSIYENVPQSSEGTDAGMIDYDEVNKSMQSTKEKPSRWVQEQIEWAEENGKLEDN
ncbi:hypothetical protein K4S80_02045 [Staphylococcus epidermidis]|uniref:hypothetical protein n=1 Tax=Staphylococcus epidermidis TaxID=1282 RepID=UPI0020966912|nr:hypothetical protein [Staphylococcus epidermidis]MCG1064118.1 hypothetical protein [Staphylococcus epidermidis]MCG1149468.1 hypothetical protein [Staphylococcus epidermidis]MCG1151895.1 hypothetical protein [Staphylococcus epidermidis]MCG1627025.1 hypothetical protein [Staphylococcus epidermidis]MCG1764733.1 hypothetical protein [Staphylococcus epidermidis]